MTHLPLGVVEVCRHGDDCLADASPQIRLGSFPHLRQCEGADLAGRVLLATGLPAVKEPPCLTHRKPQLAITYNL